MRLRKLFGLVTGAMIAHFAAHADGIVDPSRAPYLEAFKGKTVAFLPLSMGFDLTQAWGAVMKQQADQLGYKFVIRDPNWSTDAGAQALTQLISEKPYAIVLQNPDIQSYARLLKKAEQDGIYVLQVNMKSAFPTEFYAGTDYNGLGEQAAKLVVDRCGKASGKSGKIAIVQGVLTGGASVYQMEGVSKVLADHPEIKVVSNQAADWDGSKARAITETVLQQNPDLCGVIGFWDGQDIGIGAAVREAGKTGQVYVVTSGGGAQSACDNVANGTFDAYFNYDAVGQGRDLNDGLRVLFQSNPKPGTMKVMLYSKVTLLTKANLRPGMCWTKETLAQ
jgi:ABC-type sugar transport system substrate-binding protein